MYTMQVMACGIGYCLHFNSPVFLPQSMFITQCFRGDQSIACLVCRQIKQFRATSEVVPCH